MSVVWVDAVAALQAAAVGIWLHVVLGRPAAVQQAAAWVQAAQVAVAAEPPAPPVPLAPPPPFVPPVPVPLEPPVLVVPPVPVPLVPPAPLAHLGAARTQASNCVQSDILRQFE
jgi:hypothetical protein